MFLRKSTQLLIIITFLGTNSYKIFLECTKKCDKQGYSDLEKCRYLSGAEFYKCYSRQLLKELRCNKDCQNEFKYRRKKGIK